MVRHDNAGMRSIAAEDHVAAGLPTKHETGALQSPPDFATGQPGGETRQGRLCGLDFYEFLASFCGDWIPCITAIFQIELDRLADVGKRVGASIPLAYASGKAGTLTT